MITDSDIIVQLKQKDLGNYPDLSKLEPLEQGLWVLQIVKDELQIKALSSTAISKVLAEIFEVEVSEIAITRAFARARGKIKPHRDGKNIFYEIMKLGRVILKSQFGKENLNDVQFFSGRECWSDVNITFPKMIKQLTGDLNIVDRYYGFGTFNALHKFGKERRVNFLTEALGRKDAQDTNNFKIEFMKFKKEFKNVEFRKLDTNDGIHDRYIISDNALLIIGHGLKDMGTKESFVIYLPKEKIQSFLLILKDSFEEKWKKAKPIVP